MDCGGNRSATPLWIRRTRKTRAVRPYWRAPEIQSAGTKTSNIEHRTSNIERGATDRRADFSPHHIAHRTKRLKPSGTAGPAGAQAE